MGKIHGITVKLWNRTQTGLDGFNRPIYEEIAEDIENVLVGEPSADEIRDTLELTEKHVVYTLAIPKGDTHTWTDRKVSFFGEDFRVIGAPVKGIDDLVPLEWNGKVKVERYG